MAEKYQQITTPTGTAYYAHLFKPAVFEGKQGDFEVSMVFDDVYTEKLKRIIMATLAKAKESEQFKGKKWRKEPLLSFTEKDLDDETFNGATVFKFKMKPEGTNRKTGETFKRKVVVFDTAKKPVKDINIGNGTKMKICAQIVPYHTSSSVNGVGLYMEAVQIIDLVEWTGEKSADAYGFGEEEGYTADFEEESPDYSLEREAAEAACDF